MSKKIFTYERTRLLVASTLAPLIACVFFGMSLGLSGLYGSDAPGHIYAATQLDGYALQTVLFFLIGKYAKYPFLQFQFAVWETVLVMLNWMLCQKFMKRFFQIGNGITLFVSTGLFFLCSIYIPRFYPFFYRYSLGTQPWHNSTQLGMRLGATLFLYYFLNVYPTYQVGLSKLEWLRLSGVLALTTMFKPNFMISFCFAIVIALLIDIIEYKSLDSVKQAAKLGSIVIPALIVLSIQYLLIYVRGNPDSSSGIQVVFFSNILWEGGAYHMALKFGRDLAFPIITWVITVWKSDDTDVFVGKITRKEKKNLHFLLLMYIVSIIVLSLFKESGPRADHGNFTWGVLVTYFTLFLYSVPFFIQSMNTYYGKRLTTGCGTMLLDLLFVLGIILLIFHLISGVIYFVTISSGVTYFR